MFTFAWIGIVPMVPLNAYNLQLRKSVNKFNLQLFCLMNRFSCIEIVSKIIQKTLD